MYWAVEGAAVLSLFLPAVLSAPTWEDTASKIFENGTDVDIPVSTPQPPNSAVAVEETTTESSLFRRRITRPVRVLSAAERTHKQRLSLGLSVIIAWIMYFAFLLIIKNYNFG